MPNLSGWVTLLCIALAAPVAECFSQGSAFSLTGSVYDSLTRQPLQYVTVINQSRNVGATTDDAGRFRISCSPGDTILFSLLGFNRKTRNVRNDEQVMIVFLRDFAFTLEPVTVYGTFRAQGQERWQTAVEMPKLFRNPAGPGSDYLVQTFGPGISVTGLISKFSKGEKEKRKLASIREKDRRTEIYRTVIIADETRAFFKSTFSMTDAEYDKFVEAFNRAHPEVENVSTRDEVINMMVVFKASAR